MEEKEEGTRQVCMQQTRKELGKRVRERNNKELSICECRENSKVLGKCVRKKSS